MNPCQNEKVAEPIDIAMEQLLEAKRKLEEGADLRTVVGLISEGWTYARSALDAAESLCRKEEEEAERFREQDEEERLRVRKKPSEWPSMRGSGFPSPTPSDTGAAAATQPTCSGSDTSDSGRSK